MAVSYAVHNKSMNIITNIFTMYKVSPMPNYIINLYRCYGRKLYIFATFGIT